MSDRPTFFSLLASRSAVKGHGLCVGIDPDFDSQPALKILAKQRGLTAALDFFGMALVEAAALRASSVKLQSAFFEAAGLDGMRSLHSILLEAKKCDLLTVLDVKRGDIGSTMRAYGGAAFEQDLADCITVNPYLGVATFSPLLPWLAQGKGLYCVLRTSNPEAKEIQLLMTEHAGEVHPLYMVIWSQLQRWIAQHKVAQSVGVVVGATVVEELPTTTIEQFRGAHLLLPGLGAQGAELGVKHASLRSGAGSVVYPVSRALTAGGRAQTALAGGDRRALVDAICQNVDKIITDDLA